MISWHLNSPFRGDVAAVAEVWLSVVPVPPGRLPLPGPEESFDWVSCRAFIRS